MNQFMLNAQTLETSFPIAMEEELGSLFIKFQRGAEIIMDLTDMGHAQTPIPTVTDSSTGDVFVNENIRQ